MDENKLLSILAKGNKKKRGKKIGYLLQPYDQCYPLSTNFCDECKRYLSKSRGLWKTIFVRKICNRFWGLYAPKNPFAYQKGGFDLDIFHFELVSNHAVHHVNLVPAKKTSTDSFFGRDHYVLG